MDGLDWEQIAAQTTVIFVVGGLLSRSFWAKIKAEIKDAVQNAESEMKSELSANKSQIYSDMNGLGQKIENLNVEIQLQKQTDFRHDKELEQIRSRHIELDTRFNAMIEKIYNQINDLKDLIVNKIVK